MTQKKINIAIDGHSSCGKGTLAKYLAKHLAYKFIDTGAMYRAITYALQQEEIELLDKDAIKTLLAAKKVAFKYNEIEGALDSFYLSKNINTEIRLPAVSSLVSQVSEIGIIRQNLVEQQRDLAKDSGVVMDGRDIGSFVLPSAELKIFMTAAPDIRAKRRHLELTNANIDVPYEQILENVRFRDKNDSNRAINPLIKADDAKILDNSNWSIDEQNKIALDWVNETFLK